MVASPTIAATVWNRGNPNIWTVRREKPWDGYCQPTLIVRRAIEVRGLRDRIDRDAIRKHAPSAVRKVYGSER
jgi:hypothetical protein